jgi:hypothetical protein
MHANTQRLTECRLCTVSNDHKVRFNFPTVIKHQLWAAHGSGKINHFPAFDDVNLCPLAAIKQ